jgi:hypothetical protein
MKKNNKLGPALEKFMWAYHTHYGTLSNQILTEIMESNLDDPACKELFSLLSQDTKVVTEILRNSIAVNQVFFKMRNSFVDDFIKGLKEIKFLEEEDKRLKEIDEREASKSVEKNKKIKQLILDLGLTPKQKIIFKSILDVK